jgi:hypothetical protein
VHTSDLIWTDEDLNVFNEDINVLIWSDEELHMYYEHVSDDVWINDDSMPLMCVLMSIHAMLRTSRCFMSMLLFMYGLMITSMHILCVLVSFHGM